MFCLDSAGNEIEHFRPKKTFPSSSFRWPNMFYICGACNRLKLEQFPVRNQAGQIVRQPKSLIGANPFFEQSDAVLLNPADDDPQTYLTLDIAGGTFRLIPNPGISGYDLERAQMTIEILKLNRRDILPRERRAAFRQFKLNLEYAIQKHESGDLAGVAEIRAAIKESGHQTVWQEMQRQCPLIPALQQLFQRLPNDVLTW